MAEFSKQYVEQDDRDFGWDFDILEVAKSLDNGYAIPMICEGFGFIAIGKSEEGEILLAFRGEHEEINWKNLNDL
jgi:hypothetical protein